jgi:molybdate transport system substrate-binding protein
MLWRSRRDGGSRASLGARVARPLSARSRTHGRAALLAVSLQLTAALPALRTSAAETATTPSRPVNVFAAASLTESFKAIGAAFQQAHPGGAPQFNFAGSSTLVRQIREGAPADVFASADEANMQKLADAGELVGPPCIFATNRLAIAVTPGNPRDIGALSDLAAADLTLALAAPAVPVGKYAAEAFAEAGLTMPAASQEPDVRGVLNKVALGEADAGIVYVTDVRAAGARVDVVAIPDQDNVVARYPIAVVKHATDAARAAAFVDFVCSDAGRRTLAQYGFLAP